MIYIFVLGIMLGDEDIVRLGQGVGFLWSGAYFLVQYFFCFIEVYLQWSMGYLRSSLIGSIVLLFVFIDLAKVLEFQFWLEVVVRSWRQVVSERQVWIRFLCERKFQFYRNSFIMDIMIQVVLNVRFFL